MFLTSEAGSGYVGGTPSKLRRLGAHIAAVAERGGVVVLGGFGRPPEWAGGEVLGELVVRRVGGGLRAIVDSGRRVIEGGVDKLRRLADEFAYPDDTPSGVHSHLRDLVDGWADDSDALTLVMAGPAAAAGGPGATSSCG